MAQTEQDCSSSFARALRREEVILDQDGRLSISGGLMCKLGMPDTVDIYANYRFGMIGLMPGTKSKLNKRRTNSLTRTVSIAGFLSKMGLPPGSRPKHPYVSMTWHNGLPVLKVWLRRPTGDQSSIGTASAGRTMGREEDSR